MGGTMNQSDLKSEPISMMSALKPILLSLLILISGIIIGVGLTLMVTGSSSAPKKLPPGPEYMSRRMVERIVHELHLSPEQHDQLKPIVQKHMKAMDEIRQEARPKISNEIKQMNEEIAAILDERQQEIWQHKIKQIQDHFTRMRRHRRPGEERRSRRHPHSQPRQGEQHRDERFHEPPPEGPIPPGERPPLEGQPLPPNEF
jgi:hypothetical protein